MLNVIMLRAVMLNVVAQVKGSTSQGMSVNYKEKSFISLIVEVIKVKKW